MQNDLISRKRLITAIKRQPCVMIDGKQYIRLEAALGKARVAPSVSEKETEQVVRCRECKHHRSKACPMRSLDVMPGGRLYVVDDTDDNGFCYKGEKMDGGAEG